MMSAIKRVFGGMWWFVDRVSHVVITLVVFILVALLLGSMIKSGPKIQEKSALVIDLNGPLVEQYAGNGRGRLLRELQGSESDQTQLRDFIAVMDAAAKDSKIDRAVLMLDDFTGGGLALQREAAASIEKFKASGKQVVAWGSYYDQRQYYLAAHANEVYVHPMGGVLMEGYGRYRNYYKDALDRLGVKATVIRAGTYKSYGETYSANAPSKPSLEADAFLYNDLWTTYTAAVEKARKLAPGKINQVIESLPSSFAEAKGNPGQWSASVKFVDGLKTRDEFRELMISRGASDDDKKTFRQIDFHTYLSTLKPRLTGDALAVVVAEGEIVDGKAEPGRVGGVSTAALIRKAREDESVKAIVLRVNSPGGSAFASELIRRELELTRKAGKPVVVSMGSVAASGGYWISLASDEIIADPATITGSIGVVVVIPTAEKAMEKLSINTGGISTTWLGDAYDIRRGLDPRMAQIIQASINNTYAEFTTKAAAIRKTTSEKIDEVGQGRVWTGTQAKERGLVDRTGSFADALASARSKAKLADDVRVTYMETEPTRLQKLLDSIGGSMVDTWIRTMLREVAAEAMPKTPAALLTSTAARGAERELAWLAEVAVNAKTGKMLTGYVHCLCKSE